jgi:hypothetical protein
MTDRTEPSVPASAPALGSLTVDFIGEQFTVAPGEEFTIGREADLSIDDNPYLHRHFLQLSVEYELWWLSNVGGLLSATVRCRRGWRRGRSCRSCSRR